MTAEQILGRMLLAVAVTLLVGRLLAFGLARIRQPRVIGEILAGIVLGPSVIGAIHGADATLFPGAVQQALAAIGTIGLVLFMFIVGLEVDLSAVRKLGRPVAAVSFGAIAVPFAIGLMLAAPLYGGHHLVAGRPVPRLAFSLFIATALSITAFPVLARVLRERGIERTSVAQLATASAAVQDVAGWMLLAVALAAGPARGATAPLRIGLESVVFCTIMLVVVRPLVRRSTDTPVMLVGLVASASATQLIGLHSVLGAFCFGVLVRRSGEPAVAAALKERLLPLTSGLLLPIYFLTPGLGVNLRALSGHEVAELGLILACACAGKLVGGAVPARLTGLSWRDASTIGVLLNTRGLIELIVLSVGRSAGILDPALFSMLVIVALTSTLMTGPLLDALRRRQPIPAGVDGQTTNPLAGRFR